jgi:signal transduction histidine kinase/ligand-binding sensor domain-containing protein
VRRASIFSRDLAAAHRGETQPHRRLLLENKGASPPCGGKAATCLQKLTRELRSSAQRLTAHRSVVTVFALLIVAYSLVLTEPRSPIGGLLSQAQDQPPPVVQPQPTPSPSPAPSPSPSPTPPPNLHQWGAVTSFHGLPSDRTHAIAQTEFGVTWFATDGGLARYDGRRTNAINADGLPPGRILALKIDESGALWIGTDNGAARMFNGKFETVPETSGKVINAIITPQKDRAIMASDNGQIFDCQVKQDSNREMRAGEGTPGLGFAVRAIPNQPLLSADKDHPGLLKITSLALVGDKLYAGTQSRGILLIEDGEAKEIVSKPRSYFINAMATDGKGRLWVGTQARGEEGGLFDSTETLKPAKAAAQTGTVTAIQRGVGDDTWIATDGHGAFHFQNGKAAEKFTFEGTGGALRSDHIFGVFVDAEEVVWFATDKGVCRYDPNAMRAESVSEDPNANYVRALLQSPRGRLLAGTNSGLYLNDGSKKWSAIAEVGHRTIYALAEDKSGRILVATANGLFASSPNSDSSFARLPSSGSDNVRAIATVGGLTYVATYGTGVEQLQGSQRTLVWPDPNADNRWREVTSLGKDAGDRLVIGTSSGEVFFFNAKQVTTEAALDKLKGEAIWSVLADGSDLWIASAKGLFLFQSGQLKDVVPGVNARSLSISADSSQAKRIWCATVGNGLLKVAADDLFGAIVSRFDIEQGVPSQRVFAVLSVASAQGTENVIAGTNRGVVRYQPGHVIPTVLPARVIGQRIHEQSELKQRLQLTYPQNSLLLDVTAISSRTFPEQFQYGFALYDSSGKIIREKLAHDSQFTMEKLSPGAYKVVARAYTKDLLPATPLSFEFTVARAPFPLTSTALAVLLLLALIALGWGYFQNRRIHRTSAALADANRELANARLQLANETETERRRIARDLHDQTLADLRNLALLVDRLPANGRDDLRANRASSAPGALRQEIESISQEVRRICEDLSPSALENVGLSAALQFALSHAVEHAAPDRRFSYEFACDDALDEKFNLPASTQIQIYRIAQEALSNICRHSRARHVRMSASISGNDTKSTGSGDGVSTGSGSDRVEGRTDFELVIEDDGRGFDEGDSKRKSGRGVANIRARASMIDGEVEWKKRAPAGTSFKLVLPSTDRTQVG